MLLEWLLVCLVAFNVIGCGLVLFWVAVRTDKAMDVMAADKAALIRLLKQCQDRIQAQTLADYNVLRASETRDDKSHYQDRSDQGEAEIARQRTAW